MYILGISTLSNNKWTRRYIDLAKSVSEWSKDPSRKIGAVAIGDKGQILAQGFNGFPRGITDSVERYNNRELKYKFVVPLKAVQFDADAQAHVLAARAGRAPPTYAGYA